MGVEEVDDLGIRVFEGKSIMLTSVSLGDGSCSGNWLLNLRKERERPG